MRRHWDRRGIISSADRLFFAHGRLPCDPLQVTEQCIKTEKFAPLSEEQPIGASAVDIFTMVAQSVPMIIHSGLLLVQANIDTLVQNIESIVMKYGQFCVRSCGPRPSMPKLPSCKHEATDK